MKFQAGVTLRNRDHGRDPSPSPGAAMGYSACVWRPAGLSAQPAARLSELDCDQVAYGFDGQLLAPGPLDDGHCSWLFFGPVAFEPVGLLPVDPDDGAQCGAARHLVTCLCHVMVPFPLPPGGSGRTSMRLSRH